MSTPVLRGASAVVKVRGREQGERCSAPVALLLTRTSVKVKSAVQEAEEEEEAEVETVARG